LDDKISFIEAVFLWLLCSGRKLPS